MMADISGIIPVGIVPPAKPVVSSVNDKLKDKQEQKKNLKEPRENDKENNDDDSPHIDEFA